jgi:hypothetical protein
MTTATTDHQQALDLLDSMRGKYILGQALYYGIQALEAVEPAVMQERSNIEDMKLLMDEVFPLGHIIGLQKTE